MITAVPDVEYRELQEGDEFIILACDGIWSVTYSVSFGHKFASIS